jgi:hypothetical protein
MVAVRVSVTPAASIGGVAETAVTVVPLEATIVTVEEVELL